MATNAEIYTEVHDELIADAEIGATSPSKVSEHARITLTVTRISQVLQGLWEIMLRALQSAADAVPSCNAAWWKDQILAFQYGHELVLDNITKKYGYAVEDDDARIITRVAIYNQSGRGVIKVAKAGPTALDVNELAALKAYKNKILPLGSNIVILSQAADLIKIVGTVYYDPIIPLSVTQPLVEAAIVDYLATLAFAEGREGVFYKIELVDAVQTVPGVIDFQSSEIAASQDGAASLSQVVRKYVPVAGYLDIHPDHALANTLTYVAE